jgi:precorrin-6Y C5,15-methyltransferase (decarboxylating)
VTVRIDVVGLHGGTCYGSAAEQALRDADVLLGARRQLDDLAPMGLRGEPVELWGRMDELAERCRTEVAAGRRPCVLAAGDPGFFGVARVLAARLGPAALALHPAPSSVSLAFARAGLPWDDAVVASCHGRPLEAAVAAVLHAPKAAVLVSPDAPPQALGQALLAAGGASRHVWICSHLGEREENVVRTDLPGLAAGTFDALSVVVLVRPGAEVAAGASLEWGRHEDLFAHDRGMITKGEVRAVALGKLALPSAGVLWDVGAGSGSVAVEAARLAPGLRVFALDRAPSACGHIRTNARGLGVTVVEGTAPEALEDLPDPHRAFVGGGGIDVLDAVLQRVRPGGRVVATYAVLAHAVAAADRLGALVQLDVARGEPIGPDGHLRLAAENPVFVVWGDR